MERKQIDVIVGKKADAGTQAGGEKRKEVKGSPTPPEATGEVAGRSGYEYVTCPHCGAINYVWDDDYRYILYSCWHCGGGFIV
jgi:ribosomal protein S27E